MGNYSDFYKEFNYCKRQASVLYDRDYKISGTGNALLEIVIRPAIEKCQKQEIENNKPPQNFLIAMIDTGAGISAINEEKIRALNIESLSEMEIDGLNGTAGKYSNANLSIHIFNVFPDTGFLDICPVVMTTWNQERPFDFIIGWDILQYCKLSYDGPNSNFKLQFSHQI